VTRAKTVNTPAIAVLPSSNRGDAIAPRLAVAKSTTNKPIAGRLLVAAPRFAQFPPAELHTLARCKRTIRRHVAVNILRPERPPVRRIVSVSTASANVLCGAAVSLLLVLISTTRTAAAQSFDAWMRPTVRLQAIGGSGVRGELVLVPAPSGGYRLRVTASILQAPVLRHLIRPACRGLSRAGAVPRARPVLGAGGQPLLAQHPTHVRTVGVRRHGRGAFLDDRATETPG
jgi:hypothetical protein